VTVGVEGEPLMAEATFVAREAFHSNEFVSHTRRSRREK
jgi:hypothetical protein